MDDKLMHFPKFDIKINPSVVIDYWLKSLDIRQGKKTFYLNDVIKWEMRRGEVGKKTPKNETDYPEFLWRNMLIFERLSSSSNK